MIIGRQTVVVVTGASGGVGRATVRKLGERGAKVVLLARGKDGLAGAKRDVESLGGQALAIPTDVSHFDQVEAAAEQAEQEFGPIDLWVNNAMVSMYSPFMDMTPEEFKHVVEVTFLGNAYGTHSALKRMMKRDRGTIIQVGSALAFRSIPLQSAYCASKHAIQGLFESVRSELIHQKSNIQMSVVNMPALNTTQFTWTKNKMPHKARPTGTIFEPEVAADAILFAAENNRREIMVGYTTVEATLGEKVIPGLLDHYLATAAWEGSMLPERADHTKPNNFWEPVAGDHGDQKYAPRTIGKTQADPGEFMVHGVKESARPIATIPTPVEHAVASTAHFAYGAAFGALYGFVRRDTKHRSALADGVALGSVVCAAGYFGWLPMVGLTKPVWKQEFPEIAGELLRHVAYGVATTATYGVIDATT